MTDKSVSYLAFFDLDDTLIRVNSGRILVGEAHRQGWMRRRDIARSLLFLLMYKLKLAHSTKLVETMASWLKGIKESDFTKLTESIVNKHLLTNLNQVIITELEFHRNNGARTVLLSAALNYICQPIADNLGFDDVVCSHIEVDNGIFTGLPEGKLVIGPEKKERIREYCDEKGCTLETAYCYADSYSDLHMMEVVGHPVAVNHDRRLGKAARKRGWRIIN